jgi:hypothetical protein
MGKFESQLWRESELWLSTAGCERIVKQKWSGARRLAQIGQQEPPSHRAADKLPSV